MPAAASPECPITQVSSKHPRCPQLEPRDLVNRSMTGRAYNRALHDKAAMIRAISLPASPRRCFHRAQKAPPTYRTPKTPGSGVQLSFLHRASHSTRLLRKVERGNVCLLFLLAPHPHVCLATACPPARKRVLPGGVHVLHLRPIPVEMPEGEPSRWRCRRGSPVPVQMWQG